MVNSEDEPSLLEQFTKAYPIFSAERDKIRMLFCESRLDALRRTHAGSRTEFDFEASLMQESQFYGERHPWEKVILYSGEDLEPVYWSDLFVDGDTSDDAPLAFIDYFNRFLKGKGMGISLDDSFGRMYFSD